MFIGNLVQYFNQQFIKKTIQLSSSHPSGKPSNHLCIRYHYTGDWSELSLVLGRPLEGLGRAAGQLREHLL